MAENNEAEMNEHLASIDEYLEQNFMLSELENFEKEQLQSLLAQAVQELKEKWLEYNEFQSKFALTSLLKFDIFDYLGTSK